MAARAALRRGGSTTVPASLFSMVLGLAGLGNSWRVAHDLWRLPADIGEIVLAVAASIWVALLIAYLASLLLAHRGTLAELRHPVNANFVGLIGVATLLIANAALPYSHPVALVLFAGGALFTLGYAVWQTGAMWQDERGPDATTGALYLPTVAGSFVTATTAAALGFADWGRLAFGAGLFSWFAIESVLLHRLYAVGRLPPAQRPSLGIQFAPPVVGAMAYLSITQGPPDNFARALAGYGMLQALVVIRLLPWIRQQPFAPSYWAFTFGAASLATTLMRMVARGETGAVAELAPVVFVAANLVVVLIFVATLRLALQTLRLSRADRRITEPVSLPNEENRSLS